MPETRTKTEYMFLYISHYHNEYDLNSRWGEDHFGEVLKTRWKIEGSYKQVACEGLLTVIYLQVTIEAQVGVDLSVPSCHMYRSDTVV